VEIFDACSRGKLKLLTQSLSHKKYATSRDTNGRTPLHVAIMNKHEDIARYLIYKHPQAVNMTDNVSVT
jgi:ankyrin repeat protein